MDNKEFQYTYSAPEQKEIERIRKKYTGQDEKEDALTELRRLDRSVENIAMIVALTVGIVGTLVFGVGMCLCLVWDMFVAGVFVCILGFAVLIVAYPLYKSTLKSRREKVAPRILELTDYVEKQH